MFGDLEVMSALEFYQNKINPSSIVDQTYIVWIQPLQQYILTMIVILVVSKFKSTSIQSHVKNVKCNKAEMNVNYIWLIKTAYLVFTKSESF